jgi:hypothetical protein
LPSSISRRAIFGNNGGILVFNLDDPSEPYAQAFFATPYWSHRVTLDDRDILLPAGPYGLYSFDLDEFNLIEP